VEPSKEKIHKNLISYPQVARCVKAVEGGVVIQFPAYGTSRHLHIRRAPGSPIAVDASLEDGLGLLFSGRILEPDQVEVTIRLERRPVPGIYGILLKSKAFKAMASVKLGEAPIVSWAAPRKKNESAYHYVDGSSAPLWVQITRSLWFDESCLVLT
jgi:hypothetical protein